MGKLLAHVRANLVAYLALFVALGGTSVAASNVLLPKNSVGTLQLKKGAVTKPKIASSGKLCCGPIDNKIASSEAAACSSKSKVRQNFLRSARPQARLMRAPNGA